MHRAVFPALLPFVCMLLAACSDAPGASGAPDPLARDPLIARALHDPLMSDPDLSARNAANALLGVSSGAALPLLAATPEAAQAAREAGRLELREEGEIPPLPAPVAASGVIPEAGATLGQLLAALDAPASCADRLEEGFVWAARLPQIASIMPQGMVVQAGGSDAASCKVRIVRYLTPAAPEDVLQYHFTRAARAGLEPQHHAAGRAGIAGRGKDGAALVVGISTAATGHTAVDLLYRAP